MPFQHPEEVGYGHVVESYVTRMYGGLPRYLVLNGGRLLGPWWRHNTRFARHLIAAPPRSTTRNWKPPSGTNGARVSPPAG